MKSQNSIIFLTVFSLIVTVKSSLNCQTFNGKDVVCTAVGSNDYVLRRGLVSDNDKTTGITLKYCNINDLDYEAFKNDHNLRYIDLSRNKIHRLKLGVLDGAMQVTYLNLSRNLLTTLPLGLLDQMPNLDVLDLRGNKFQVLELGIFGSLHKLAYLDISRNPLLGKDIDPDLFRNNGMIKYIDFSKTDMSDSSDNLLHSFMNLDFLKLDRCSLTKIPTFATRSNLQTITHLMLPMNRISKIVETTAFINLDNLESINLAENIIEDITADVFKSLKKLKVVVLRNNILKTIPDDLFLNLKAIDNVDLSHNFIEYIPGNAFRGTSLKKLNLSHNKFTYLNANFCLELRNSGVELSKFNIDDNPWQCACLNDILKELKTYNIKYNNAKYNGNDVVCVTDKMFTCKRTPNDNDMFIEMYEYNKDK